MESISEYSEDNMTSTRTRISTGYEDTVRAKVKEMIDRAGEFTVSSLCASSGLKPTRNLRRRLTEMVYAGDIGYTIGYQESGHMVGYFHKPIEKPDQQLQLPVF